MKTPKIIVMTLTDRWTCECGWINIGHDECSRCLAKYREVSH